MGAAVGLDIGYTNVRGALLDDRGRVLRRARLPTDASRTAQVLLAQAAEMVRELGAGQDIQGVGVGIAGQCHAATGVVRRGPNLWWDDEPFGGKLASMVDRPVILRNDVQMATVGEWRHGAGGGAGDMVCLFVGTGVGGGAIIHGRLLGGTSGCGSHFGHVSVSLDGPRCACGRVGCVEAYAGGIGIAKLARDKVREDTISGLRLLKMVDDSIESITAREVSAAAQQGDPLATSIRDGVASALISGIASVVNSLDPELVVLGGAVLAGFPGLFEEVRDGVKDAVLPPIRPSLRIVPSRLGDIAGAVGAASLALTPE